MSVRAEVLRDGPIGREEPLGVPRGLKPLHAPLHAPLALAGRLVRVLRPVIEIAMLADTHVTIGAVAGDGGAVIWPLLIGPNRAKELLMLGDSLTGADAARSGLVNDVVPAAEVLPKARALVQRLADGPTWAIRWSKLAVNKWLKQQANLIMDAGLAYEALTL